MSSDRERRSVILVIEDVEETRYGIRRLLTTSGYEVITARDEEDAILLARTHSPELILMCLGLDAVRAFALARRIRARAQLSDELPIVVFYVQEMRDGAEVEAGHRIYMTRPENFDQIRSLIGRLLHKPDPRG
jgi:CheY-like chemotaxis protein